ncbi:conserved hypothetical protein [Paraburkholderia unamae]|uniref:hypothetical protein n=1 Tax=Paraburkholderia unamae TaxID=219649 RepID=UPI001CAAC235|nr:hypothetical protein [Paraburkholderia unamae]CAG9252259.1 conserved hypothetical protein [Paraburkholderia unamae]
MSYDFAEQDLVHIRSVVSHFEHEVDRARDTETGTVASLKYWRSRVTTILATPSLPMHIERQARDVLGRLDRLDDAGRRNRTGDARAPF